MAELGLEMASPTSSLAIRIQTQTKLMNGARDENCHYPGFPGGSDGNESAYNVGDLGSIPGAGRSPGKGNSNPLQYSCLENSMDREAWRGTVHGVTKSWT